MLSRTWHCWDLTAEPKLSPCAICAVWNLSLIGSRMALSQTSRSPRGRTSQWSSCEQTHGKGALGMGEGHPLAHSEDGKRLIESVCRRDKDSGGAGAGSLECLPDNSQNLAEDEQLPGRSGGETQEPGLLHSPSLLSTPPVPYRSWARGRTCNHS